MTDTKAEPPVTSDFLADVAEEADFQLQHWGETHDADKDDSFWFWTLGHIVGKVIHDPNQSVDKQRHRLRAGAALLLNWDRHVARRNGQSMDQPLMRMDQPTLWAERRRLRVRPIFAWFDLWVGVFIDREKCRAYIFPLPCIGVVVEWGAE